MLRLLSITVVLLVGSTTMSATTQPAPRPQGNEREVVVLLHGLGLAGWSMWPIGRTLRADGFRVVNLTYPSRHLPLETIAADWLPRRLAEHDVASAPKLHVVTHSMGGILLRQWRKTELAPANLGYVVMIAPPNHGSEVVDHLQNFRPFQWMMKVNGARLGTDAASIPRSLGPWPSGVGRLGIIAGGFTPNVIFARWLPGPSDGEVSVASAQLEGMADFRVLPYSHTMILWRRATHRLVRTFLRTGSFGPG